MFGKLEISGCIESLTGLHIGGGSQFAAIGAVDSVVVKDIDDDLPMIPGSSLKGKLRSLLSKQFSDGELPKEHNSDADVVKDRLENEYIDATEVKFENTISRLTGVANPRQIERAVKGMKYHMSLIYNIENENEIEEDFKTLKTAFQLLKYDYLGAAGSRGYGRVDIHDLDVKKLVVSDEAKISGILENCKSILKEV